MSNKWSNDDYRVMVHMEPNTHDSPNKPYFWCVLKYDESVGLHNMGSGWEETPERAFQAGQRWLGVLKSKKLEDKLEQSFLEMLRQEGSG